MQLTQLRLVAGTEGTDQGLQSAELMQSLFKCRQIAIVVRLDRRNGLQLAYQQAHGQASKT
ncbi:hypothetical protein QNM99_00510 [Pseudomonas sp. PCH446]